MSRHVPRHTFRWSPLPPPSVSWCHGRHKATQATQVPITLTQHDIAAAPCDMTHPMWRHRGTARPKPPPPPPPPPAVAGKAPIEGELLLLSMVTTSEVMKFKDRK